MRRCFISVFCLLSAIVHAALQAAGAAPEIVIVPVSALHPTQAYIAHDQVNYTLQRYQTDRQKLFDDLCENRGQGDEAVFTPDSDPRDAATYRCAGAAEPGANAAAMKTAVRGPGGQLYLTDGHHTFSIFHDFDELGSGTEVAVVVTHDRSALTEAQFWQWLQDSHLTWLYDADGQQIDHQQIPAELGRLALADDPYRAAMYFLRDLVWQRPQPAMPFAEFYWAQHIRNQEALHASGLDSAADYLRWLQNISMYMAELPAQTVIGPQGQGPDEMGRLPPAQQQNIGVLLCDQDKPGRLAMALTARGITAGCTP